MTTHLSFSMKLWTTHHVTTYQPAGESKWLTSTLLITCLLCCKLTFLLLFASKSKPKQPNVLLKQFTSASQSSTAKMRDACSSKTMFATLSSCASHQEKPISSSRTKIYSKLSSRYHINLNRISKLEIWPSLVTMFYKDTYRNYINSLLKHIRYRASRCCIQHRL